ncbi:MAG: hypothetical protein PHS14_13120 [Elusimicrobia bacterium]|nr:hypothetical protein [Elusimicrobiota bacterium]
MTATTLSGVLLAGVAGSRPAANAVAAGTLYAATDTHLITQSDGVSTWSTWINAAGSGLTNPMTTTGDIIYSSDNSGTAARLGIGAAGTILTGGTTPSWKGPLASYVYNRTTAGDYTISSATYAAIDATNMNPTLTTGAHRCRVRLSGAFAGPGSGNSMGITLKVDGTDVASGNTFGLMEDNIGANNAGGVMIDFLTDVLTAASHTFELFWKASAGTATLRGTAGHALLQFSVEETLLTT